MIWTSKLVIENIKADGTIIVATLKYNWLDCSVRSQRTSSMNRTRHFDPLNASIYVYDRTRRSFDCLYGVYRTARLTDSEWRFFSTIEPHSMIYIRTLMLVLVILCTSISCWIVLTSCWLVEKSFSVHVAQHEIQVLRVYRFHGQASHCPPPGQV